MSVIDQIKREEGLRLKPYHCTQGKLTIGYGRNLDDRGITEQEADRMLEHDVREVTAELQDRLPVFAALNQARKDALINMAFQLGVGGVLRFRKMIVALERADWVEARRQALDSRWAEQTPARADRVARQLERGIEINV